MSVGGSLIVPEGIDAGFLSNFKKFVEGEIAGGERRFVIIAGGGRTARNYQETASQVANLDNEDLDWLGIHATRLNGHLIRTIFKGMAHPVMINNPSDILNVSRDAKVVVAAGYRPGASTDLRAIQIAKLVEAHKVVNLSNTDYVYTADPREDKDAKKLENITWADFRKLIPSEWDPGLSSPFDPIAAKEAEENNIEVANINGNNLAELKNYLEGEEFVGTRIH